MSAHGFKSVFMVGGIAAAALGCYLVSLRVASERAELESVENKIVLAQRDIRLLSTEIGTRGRLAQLERWNVKVIRLSAPSADQFVESSFQLATLAKPEAKPAIEAPIVYASAPAPRAARSGRDQRRRQQARALRTSRPVADMMHVAGYAKPAPKAAALAPLAAKPAHAPSRRASPSRPSPRPSPRLRRNPSKPRRLIRSAPCRLRRARPRASPTAPRQRAPATKPATSKESGSRQ